MPSRCFQDESRCFGSKHVVVFDFVSGSPDSDHPETPEKEVGSLSQRKTIPGKNFASWFFWHVLAVFSCSGVLETRWKKDRNISEPLRSALHIVQDHKVLRDLRSIRVSSDRSAAICWLQVLSETGGVMQYGANTFLSVRDSFESHWITMTIFQIITLLQNYSGWKFHQWLQTTSSDEVGCSNSAFLDTNKHDVRTVEERQWCQHMSTHILCSSPQCCTGCLIVLLDMLSSELVQPYCIRIVSNSACICGRY